jgi:hypothetical protein
MTIAVRILCFVCKTLEVFLQEHSCHFCNVGYGVPSIGLARLIFPAFTEVL